MTRAWHREPSSQIALLPNTLKTYRLEHLRVPLTCRNRSDQCLSQSNSELGMRLQIQWLISPCRLKTFVECGIGDVQCFGRVKITAASCHHRSATVRSLVSALGRSRNCWRRQVGAYSS